MTKILTYKSLIEEQETKIDDLETKTESLKYLLRTTERLINYNTKYQSNINFELGNEIEEQRELITTLMKGMFLLSIANVATIAIVLYLIWG